MGGVVSGVTCVFSFRVAGSGVRTGEELVRLRILPYTALPTALLSVLSGECTALCMASSEGSHAPTDAGPEVAERAASARTRVARGAESVARGSIA
eukprot:4516740-Prymnesium_polylepis.1